MANSFSVNINCVCWRVRRVRGPSGQTNTSPCQHGHERVRIYGKEVVTAIILGGA
jgi:hypothetical protein